ncbi:DUF2474 domain-containing protein [Bradyrhizobium sp. NBAIM14]|nr:DUF2474 domain-containing protein [Bradyrhizobium sp. NBAIM14]MCA1500130.1 DUF2474 domain-containing protein [Bradyrhizobium sp. NBAIM14]
MANGPPVQDRSTSGTLAQRVRWFAVLWLGGVGTVLLISYGLRLWIAPE